MSETNDVGFWRGTAVFAIALLVIGVAAGSYGYAQLRTELNQADFALDEALSRAERAETKLRGIEYRHDLAILKLRIGLEMARANANAPKGP